MAHAAKHQNKYRRGLCWEHLLFQLASKTLWFCWTRVLSHSSCFISSIFMFRQCLILLNTTWRQKLDCLLFARDRATREFVATIARERNEQLQTQAIAATQRWELPRWHTTAHVQGNCWGYDSLNGQVLRIKDYQFFKLGINWDVSALQSANAITEKKILSWKTGEVSQW